VSCSRATSIAPPGKTPETLSRSLAIATGSANSPYTATSAASAGRWRANCSMSCPPQEPEFDAAIHSNTPEAKCPSNRAAVSRKASWQGDRGHPHRLRRASRRTRTPSAARRRRGGCIQSRPPQLAGQRPERGLHLRNGRHPSLLACFVTLTSPITGRRSSERRTSRCAGTFLLL